MKVDENKIYKKNKRKNILTGISIFLLVVLIAGTWFTAGMVGIRRIEGLLGSEEFKEAYHSMYDRTEKNKKTDFEIKDKIEEITEMEALLEEQNNVDSLNITDSVGTNAIVTDVTTVVEKVMPSVVSITNSYTERYINPMDGEVYLGESEASGSGIIFGQNDQEILIITNNHVVDGSDVLLVQFIDGKVAEAQVKGVDTTIDLAVIAIQITDINDGTMDKIARARFGNSESLKVGEPAIAIGNALGYGQSVTTGVISALGRTVGDETSGIYEDLIQTDAAINPGNSGGSLLNIKGEVIGINSNKIGGTAIEGMGYAIPISKAMPIISELIKIETRIKILESEQGYIGIKGVDVTSDINEIYGIPLGIYVSSVYDGTGAQVAGLLKGDIIIEMNENKIMTMQQLQYELQYFAKGDIISLTVQRYTEKGYTEEIIEVELVDLDKLND